MNEAKKYKAKKVCTTYRGTWSSLVEYEYRGKTYEVEYANGISYCVTSPKIQHEIAQAKIDDELDNPKPVNPEAKPFNLDEIFEMMGW